MVPREVKPSEIAGAFVVRDPKWRSKIFVGGLLLLLVHPVGWPVALGYRKALIAHLSSGQDPLLPDWNRKIPYYFCEGMKAMGVIFGYLSPLYFALLLIILANGGTPDLTWLFTAIFFMIFIMLSTLSFPAIVSYQTFLSDKIGRAHV